MFCTFENTEPRKEPRSYLMPHKPTVEEGNSTAEYNSRVKVFDELKAKYRDNVKIETLDELKIFLVKHYSRVPLTFFTLYNYLKFVENTDIKNIKNWIGGKYVYPLEEKFNNTVENERDRTLTTRDGIVRSNSMDLDKSIKYITRAVENGYVSEELKTKLQGMYAFVDENRGNSLSSTYIDLSLQRYRLV
tara:strand:+ start:102 stop:671 length:570 start_codon:yes stop_codon:yes gene_type:complete